MLADFYPAHRGTTQALIRGPTRTYVDAFALRSGEAASQRGRRSGTHTQSANFLSVRCRPCLYVPWCGAARCSHKRGKLTGTQMSEFTRSLSCFPAPLSSQLDTNKRANLPLSAPSSSSCSTTALFHPLSCHYSTLF